MVDVEKNTDELGGRAKTRAAFCSFLCIHFNSLPDVKFVEQVRHPNITAMLQALQNDASIHEDIATGASLMENFLKETQAEAPDRLSEKLGVDRTRLYRGLSPNYGPPPPYEMVWSKTWQDVRLLSVLAATYRENDLQPSEDVHERQDYLGVELDFIHILAEREAAAWEAGSTGRAQSLLETQKTFFKEHLQPWVNFFIKSAFEYVKTDFYQGHLLMMRGFMDDLGKEFAEAPAAPKS